MYANARTVRKELAAMIETTGRGRPKEGAATQTKVAMRLGVSQGTMSLFLSGREQHPPRKVLVALGFDPNPYWRRK